MRASGQGMYVRAEDRSAVWKIKALCERKSMKGISGGCRAKERR